MRLLIAACLLAWAVGLPPQTMAASLEEGAEGEVQTLAPITVIGLIDTPATGRSVLAGEVIEKLPVGNGSLGEILRLFPDVQLDEAANSSRTGGEILSPSVAISGGKIFQNNVLIDGIANNSLLDPATSTAEADVVTDVGGHPLERFPGSQLIEEITVYDSNIPARYGDFTGGVVEAKTRNPGPDPGGELSYRTTRSEWTRFHIAREDRDDFAAGGRSDLQPKFEKHDYGATLNLPLAEGMGLLAAYRRLDSRIPLPYFDRSRSEERRLQEYFLKYAWEVSPADRLEATLSSTPYREERFFRTVRGSDFDVELGGLAVQGGWEHFFATGALRIDGAYRSSRNQRSGPKDFRVWAASDSKDWGRLVDSAFSPEGGFGDVEKTQESIDLKGGFGFEPLFFGAVRHEFTTGLDLARTVGSFIRRETTYVYQGARLSPDILCGGNDFDCVEHEQFFTARQVYAGGARTATIDQFALHGEDQIHYRRLVLRPGLRLSYDDLMRNANLAPRLALTYDLFSSGATVLIAGVNRYYGATLLTAKLREAQTAFTTESRTSFQNLPQPWEPSAGQGPNATRFTELKTPFADELALGVDQGLWGGRLSLKYVRREGHDEFARTYSPVQPDGLRYYTLNNNGRSRHDSYRLTWERSWARHFFSLNATYQQTTTSNAGYDTVLDSEELGDRVWFGDELIPRNELPAANYNRPTVVNLTWIAELPYGLTFTNLTRYRSGYREIEKTGELRALPGAEQSIDPVTGEAVFAAAEVYAKTSHAAVVLFDWKFGWRPPALHSRNLLLTLEVNNVFDARSRTGGTTTTFEMGRQFWAGVDYRF